MAIRWQPRIQGAERCHCSMRERSVPTFFSRKGSKPRYGDSRCRDDIVVVVDIGASA